VTTAQSRLPMFTVSKRDSLFETETLQCDWLPLCWILRRLN